MARRNKVLAGSCAERLESRRLLSTLTITGGGGGNPPVTVASGGICVVTGTSGNDKVRITANSAGGFVVTLNGKAYDRSTSHIRGFDIHTGSGDDDVRFQLPAKAKFAKLRNTIDGGNGNDVIVGSAGRDTIFGGRGRDTLSGGAGNDLIDGGAGADVISGGKGNDSITGSAGDDIIRDTKGRNVIDVSDRADTINGRKGATASKSASVDLNDNDLVVNRGVFSDIKGLVTTGYSATPGAGKTGIISTGQNSSGKTILALFDNSLVGLTQWPTGNGQTIGGSAIVGKYTYFGDATLDGQVTAEDYLVLDANRNTAPAAGVAWIKGDMTNDGQVTADDYLVLDANRGLRVGAPLPPQ